MLIDVLIENRKALRRASIFNQQSKISNQQFFIQIGAAPAQLPKPIGYTPSGEKGGRAGNSGASGYPSTNPAAA